MENLETLEKIKAFVEELNVDTTKFYNGNKSAGTRARKTCQEIKSLTQQLRTEILNHSKSEK
jgi:hypothetical protein